jgi:hypothetical protein
VESFSIQTVWPAALSPFAGGSGLVAGTDPMARLTEPSGRLLVIRAHDEKDGFAGGLARFERTELPGERSVHIADRLLTGDASDGQ